jgi:glycosyltransferase involved in cell wall biosynthesis
MKILLIAYYYPPLNTGGTARPAKIAKYLPHFGHQVTVLTHTYGKTAFPFPSEESQSEVIRVRDISYNKERKGIKKMVWLFLRLITEVFNRLGCYHSIYSWWKQRVMKHSEKIIQMAKPDVILVTYPPVETLEIGLYLSSKFGIPLVSDFRDGLLFEPIEQKRMKQYRCIRDRYADIEKQVVQNSKMITTIAQPITGYFKETYQFNHSYIISNGYDPEDFDNLPSQNLLDNVYFNIVFTGRFALSDKYNRVDFFFDSLRRLDDEKGGCLNKLKVHLIGEYRKNEIELLQDLIDKKIIEIHGFVEKPVALKFQREADLLLIITPPDRKSATSIKIFEYLYAGKPVLALTHKTILEDIIRDTKTGWIVHPHKPDEISQLLQRILSEPGFYKSLKPDKKKIETYSVKHQVEKLGILLKNLEIKTMKA